MLDDTEIEAPGCEKDWHDLTELECAAADLLGWTEETWQAGDFEPYQRHYDELDENEQATVFMLEMDPQCFVASVGV